MVCFLHVFYKQMCKPPAESRFLKEFKLMKFKMKLQFEARNSHLNLSHMFQLAILKTLCEKERMAFAALKESLQHDTAALHSLFYRSVDLKTNMLREPSNDEKIDRLASKIQYHTKQIATGTAL
jgi:hypothetical protein